MSTCGPVLGWDGHLSPVTVREKWDGELEHDIKKLIEYNAYKLP